MKAEELFVGALVRVNRDRLCIKKDTIVEVRAVDADDKLIEKGLIGVAHCRPMDDNQFEGGIWCEYLAPIPLTPEILEKNGFERTSDGWECNESDVLTIAIHDGDSCDIWFAEAPFDHKHLTYVLPFTRSVHELQHALRLCGITLNIEV